MIISPGLTNAEYAHFARFRGAMVYLYISIMTSLPPVGRIAILLVYLKSTLYHTDLFASIVWSVLLIVVWCDLVCAGLYYTLHFRSLLKSLVVIYSNLIAFIVVVKYIQVKQKSILHALWTNLHHLLGRSMFRLSEISLLVSSMAQTTRYIHLQEEMLDYNRFWSSYLSFVYMFFVLLISFILHISLFSAISLYINITFALAFAFHILCLSVVNHYCGSIVLRSTRLATQYTSALIRYSNRFGTSHMIKVCASVQ